MAPHVKKIANFIKNHLHLEHQFDLKDFLKRYEKVHSQPLLRSNLLDKFPWRTHKYKAQILNLIDNSIEGKDREKLEFYLSLGWRDGLDKFYTDALKKVVLAKWHNSHEDILDYLSELKDDFFTDDVFEIATNSFYKRFDDENESTLRKCIHTLKAINSENANEKIKLLKSLGNVNIEQVLKMYD